MGLSKLIKKVGKTFNPVSYANDAIKKGLGFGKSKGSGPGDSGQEAALREGYGAALATNAQSLSDLPKQYEPARKALAQGKTSAIQYAQDRGTQDAASAKQSLASRGLGNTTIYENAQQGVSANVSRQVADIEAMYAQVLGNLAMSEGQNRQRIMGNQAQLRMGLGQSLAGQKNTQQAFQQQWELSQNPDAWLDSLFQLGGTAVGAYIGKNI